MAVNPTIEVTMPPMGESVTEGTILEWHKKEGDRVEVDEILVEISTDKVDAEVPSPAAGTIMKLHRAEGDTVTVGELLAEIAPSNGAGPAAAPAPSAPAEPVAEAPAEPAAEAAPPEPAAAAPPPPAPPAAPADGAGEVIDITTPAGGESVTEGTILEWTVKVGDVVKDGDTVVEISTDKVDMELPAPAGGTITEILV